MQNPTTRHRWLTLDEGVVAVLAAALAIFLIVFAAGCTGAPTAPTPDIVGSLVAGAPAGNGETAESAASGELLRVRIPPPATNLSHPVLTLTVTPDGARDRVRASIGGIVGVSFYPGSGEKMPPNPLNGHGGQSITVRCDRTASWVNGRPRIRTLPAGQRRRGDGVDVRVWVEHNGRRLTHAGNAWASDGGSDYRVCAP